MGATLFGPGSARAATPQQSGSRRRDNLTLVYQNVLTVIVRLRAKRQAISDARSFRAQFQGALKLAEKEGVSKLYPQDDVRLSTFAVVAFLDESVQTSNDVAFSDWPRMPLQEEMFGHAQAGEVFFQHIDQLLNRADSQSTADVLEVYALCILLGYRGRYGLGDQGSVRGILDAIAEKIRRVRGPLSGFSPNWTIPEGAVHTTVSDPLMKKLGLIALSSVGAALLLFLIYKVVLYNEASFLRSIAALRVWVGL